MKGHEAFIKAAAGYNEQDIFFLFIGSKNTSYYRNYLKELDELKILGGRHQWIDDEEDMPGIYSAVDIVTSSSYYGEGFSNVLAEAMSCGAVCVATDVGDSSQIVNNDLLIRPRNIKDLINAWSNATDLLRSDLIDDYRTQARQKILDNYDISVMTQKTLQVIEEVIH